MTLDFRLAHPLSPPSPSLTLLPRSHLPVWVEVIMKASPLRDVFIFSPWPSAYQLIVIPFGAQGVVEFKWMFYCIIFMPPDVWKSNHVLELFYFLLTLQVFNLSFSVLETPCNKNHSAIWEERNESFLILIRTQVLSKLIYPSTC